MVPKINPGVAFGNIFFGLQKGQDEQRLELKSKL
jgi:hypothetical protein